MKVITGNPNAEGNRLYFARVQFATGWVPWSKESRDKGYAEAQAKLVSLTDAAGRPVQLCYYLQPAAVFSANGTPPKPTLKVVAEYLNGLETAEVSAN